MLKQVAARRLIMVLLLLLGVSVAAAAIAPERRGPAGPTDETSTTTTTEEEPPPTPAEVLEREVMASVKQPETIRAEVGDRLVLSVSTQRPAEIAIDPLGLVANADPLTPAEFDLLLGEPEDIAITDSGTGEVVGRILVGTEHSEAK